jgi:2-oxo-4-hydroxy-4-carboxy-5-ureidoimidazoline decarboxylase
MPFIVCVRRHGKESILRQFERRMQHSLEQETEAALTEIFRIAALRLDRRIEAPDKLPVNGRLSTHVLDTQGGRPAAGLAIELVELGGGESPVLARAVTNRDGRTDEPLVAGRPLPIARYELRFHVGDYFARGPAAPADPPFLDVIPVRFAVAEPEGLYHVPLLVTPWSYTTYRGS